jgi:hypothetical protein
MNSLGITPPTMLVLERDVVAEVELLGLGFCGREGLER